MKKAFRFFLAPMAVCSFFLFSFPAAHAEEMTPQQGVETFLASIRSMEFPVKDAGGHSGRLQKANAFLDLDTMGKKSLGSHWQEASPENQKEFLQLLWSLIEWVAYPRSSKFISNYEISYPEVKPAGNGFQVHSIIKQQAEGLDAAVEYHLYQKDAQWKIDDIVLDDVSITEDLGSQFDRLIKDSGFSGLLGKMRDRLDQAKKENGVSA